MLTANELKAEIRAVMLKLQVEQSSITRAELHVALYALQHELILTLERELERKVAA